MEAGRVAGGEMFASLKNRIKEETGTDVTLQPRLVSLSEQVYFALSTTAGLLSTNPRCSILAGQ